MLNRHLLGFVFLLCTTSATLADRVYQFVDYPDLQAGHSLSGTITTTDDAPDDGLLAEEEILDWQWEVSDGLEVTTGQMHPIEPDSNSLTEVVGIEIDAQGVYYSHDLGRSFELESNTNLNSRGFNIYRLAWFIGDPDTPSQYAFFGIKGGDVAFQSWDSEIPANPDRWLIATVVPEPTTCALCGVVCGIAFMNRRLR